MNSIKEKIGENLCLGAVLAIVFGIFMAVLCKTGGKGMFAAIFEGGFMFVGAILPSAVLVGVIRTVVDVVLLGYEAIVEKKTSPASLRGGKTYTSESKLENSGVSIKDTLDL